MAAHPKLPPSRERRLLAILDLGEPLSSACRAVGISTTAVRARAARDAMFAERLEAARDRGRGDAAADDWRVAARALERGFPERWSMPWDIGGPG